MTGHFRGRILPCWFVISLVSVRCNPNLKILQPRWQFLSHHVVLWAHFSWLCTLHGGKFNACGIGWRRIRIHFPTSSIIHARWWSVSRNLPTFSLGSVAQPLQPHQFKPDDSRSLVSCRPGFLLVYDGLSQRALCSRIQSGSPTTKNKKDATSFLLFLGASFLARGLEFEFLFRSCCGSLVCYRSTFFWLDQISCRCHVFPSVMGSQFRVND